MVANHGSLRKKVVCFNDIASFGLTTNPPKEAKGMTCDVFFATDYHGYSRCVRAVQCHSVAIIFWLWFFTSEFHGCHSVLVRAVPLPWSFVYGFLHRSFTDIHGCFPFHSVAGTIAFDIGRNRIYTAHPCDSVKFRCYKIKGPWTWMKWEIWGTLCMNFLDNKVRHIWLIHQQREQSSQIRPK